MLACRSGFRLNDLSPASSDNPASTRDVTYSDFSPADMDERRTSINPRNLRISQLMDVLRLDYFLPQSIFYYPWGYVSIEGADRVDGMRLSTSVVRFGNGQMRRVVLPPAVMVLCYVLLAAVVLRHRPVSIVEYILFISAGGNYIQSLHRRGVAILASQR